MRIIFLFLLLFSGTASAGLGSVIDSLYEKKVNYNVTVVDRDGVPVPFAIVWKIVRFRHRDIDPPKVMERLLMRYREDVDLVHDVKLHPSLLVYYADRFGQVQMVAEAKSPEDRQAGMMLVAFGALKRGFQPGITVDESRLNTAKNIVIHITRIAQSAQDPLLSEFDEIRCAAQSGADTGGALSQDAVAELDARLRQLAERARQENKNDIAATIFHYLAYMPSVNVVKDGSGHTFIRGYTNGYDESIPKRRADLETALALNTSNPQLLYLRMWRFHRDAGALKFSATLGQRLGFLSDAEALRSRFGDRLWPFDFQDEWTQYAQVGEYDKSCARINRFHQFEPSYFFMQEWDSNLDFLAYIAKKRGDTFTCTFTVPEK